MVFQTLKLQKLLIFIVSSNENLTAADIKTWASERLTAYKIPKHIEFRDELPKTNVGKVLRRELRDEEMAKSN